MTEPLSPREAGRLLHWTVNDLARVLKRVDPDDVPSEVAPASAPTRAMIVPRIRVLVSVPFPVLGNGGRP